MESYSYEAIKLLSYEAKERVHELRTEKEESIYQNYKERKGYLRTTHFRRDYEAKRILKSKKALTLMVAVVLVFMTAFVAEARLFGPHNEGRLR